jgi:hypothetical protein
MAQVITPPAIGMQEQISKNWYRAEALRKIKHDLINAYSDTEDEPVRRELKNAIDSIEAARCILDPRLNLKPVKRVRPR